MALTCSSRDRPTPWTARGLLHAIVLSSSSLLALAWPDPAHAQAMPEAGPGAEAVPPPPAAPGHPDAGSQPAEDTAAARASVQPAPAELATEAPRAPTVEPPAEPQVAATVAPPATRSRAPLPAPAARPSEVTVSGAVGEGVTIEARNRFSLNVKSRFQLRYQLDVPPKDATGERGLSQLVNINTARLALSGFAFRPQLKYQLQLAFGGRDYRDGAISPVYDAYLDYEVHRDLRIRAGQFFVPFDRLRTVRESALQMAERPRPVAELTLDRDVGVVLYSERFLGDSSPVAWRLGAFGGGGTNLSVGKKPGALLMGRVELRPLGDLDDDSEGDLKRRKNPALALGAGVAGNWNTNRVRSTTGATFSEGTTDYRHAAADLVFKWLGVALEGEVVWRKASANTITSEDADGNSTTEYTRSGSGWVAQASYVFDPPIELVGRLARLKARANTDPTLGSEADSRGQEIGAGVNYYLNGHKFKLQTSWIARTSTDFDLKQATHGVYALLDATF
jgi:phosphate-selective porin OprO/OprP